LSDNPFLLSANLERIISNREESFVLEKHDVSTTVGILAGRYTGLPHDLLVKRFNYKGFFHFLAKLVFGSRAQHLYKINLRLWEMGLPVPEPFACIELTWKQRNSFYLSSVIENSMNLVHIFNNPQLSKYENIACLLARNVADWHLAGAVHGDLKWSNILVQENPDAMSIFFIDLDQTKLYGAPNIAGIIKDLARFYRNGLELGAEAWVDSKFLPEYMACVPSDIKNRIDVDHIKDKAHKDWKKKDRRRT
jgi:tRNA A-37 threonylcarbamoyl transferase component Bud32